MDYSIMQYAEGCRAEQQYQATCIRMQNRLTASCNMPGDVENSEKIMQYAAAVRVDPDGHV